MVSGLHHGRELRRLTALQVYQYARHYCAWPSVAETVRWAASKGVRIGKRRAVTASFHALRELGFLLHCGNTHDPEGGWRLTRDGYAFIQRSPLSIEPSRRIPRRDRNNPYRYRARRKAQVLRARLDGIKAFDTEPYSRYIFDSDPLPDSDLPLMQDGLECKGSPSFRNSGSSSS